MAAHRSRAVQRSPFAGERTRQRLTAAGVHQRLLRLLAPGDVVVSTWQHDGHPDHDATGWAPRMAGDMVGCRFLLVPVWMQH